MRVFLARHGETSWNAEHRLQGQSNAPLTPRGREHAQALAALLEGVALDAIYTSTLERTIDTAHPVAAAHGIAPVACPELAEISYGVLEGRTPHDPDPQTHRLMRARKADPLSFRAPGGESYAELRVRVATFVSRIADRHAGGTILVVGHRATNRVLRGLLLGLSLAESLAFKQKHDCVLEIRTGTAPECIEHRHAPATERE